MSSKSKIVTIIAIIGLAVLIVILNYFSSELFSFRHWNVIRRVYFTNTFVKAEVVENSKKIEAGLSGRDELPEGRGMLFVMPNNGFQRFWMKGMQFPIDIVWLEQGRVIGCEKNIFPEDDRVFTSPSRASFVLEVPSGFCDRYNVQINDSVGIQ